MPLRPHLGGDRNYLGTGNQIMKTGVPAENWWLSISGPCASKEYGGRFETISSGNFTAQGFQCAGGETVSNPEYDPNGYFYGIEFASDSADDFAVQIFNPGSCTGQPTADFNGSDFATTFTLRNHDSFDPAAASVLIAPTSSTVCNGWFELGIISHPTRGTYFLQVQTIGKTPPGSLQHGLNSYAVRVTNGTGTTWDDSSACSIDPTDGLHTDSLCPVVYAFGPIGLYMNNPTGIPSPQSTSDLVKTDRSAGGHTLQLDLWDVGEGSHAIQIIDPAGSSVPFNWTVPCWDPGESIDACSDVAPLGGRGVPGVVNSATVNVPGTGDVPNAVDAGGSSTSCDPQPGPNRVSCSKLSDRLLRITIPLPADIDAAYGGATWWKVRYSSSSAPIDRTTRSATILP